MYGTFQYKNLGSVKISGTVQDDSQAIFTPCTYKIKDVSVLEGPKVGPILEVGSFRGRFCDQARTNEIIIANGKLEQVTNSKKDSNYKYFRVLLGNKPRDYLILQT